MLILWCEIERVERQLLPLLQERGEQVAVCRSGTETLAALTEDPEAGLIVACFAGLPLTRTRAACRRFRGEVPGRRLRLLGVLEPGHLLEYHPAWGLDDFLLFPVQAAELSARLTALAWRDRDLHAESLLKLGPLVIDAARHEVLADNLSIDLTIKEYDLLLLLVSSRDKLLSRETILAEVWGRDYYGGERTVDVHVRRLRAKLGNLAPAIETVHGLGYRFSLRRLG